MAAEALNPKLAAEGFLAFYADNDVDTVTADRNQMAYAFVSSTASLVGQEIVPQDDRHPCNQSEGLGRPGSAASGSATIAGSGH